MSNEPVVTAASIVGLISAAISFARLMGWIKLNDDQYNSLMIFIGMALPIGLAIVVRRQVTPLRTPRDLDGEPLTRSDNTPSIDEYKKFKQQATEMNEAIDNRIIK